MDTSWSILHYTDSGICCSQTPTVTLNLRENKKRWGMMPKHIAYQFPNCIVQERAGTTGPGHLKVSSEQNHRCAKNQYESSHAAGKGSVRLHALCQQKNNLKGHLVAVQSVLESHLNTQNYNQLSAFHFHRCSSAQCTVHCPHILYCTSVTWEGLQHGSRGARLNRFHRTGW